MTSSDHHQREEKRIIIMFQVALVCNNTPEVKLAAIISKYLQLQAKQTLVLKANAKYLKYNGKFFFCGKLSLFYSAIT